MEFSGGSEYRLRPIWVKSGYFQVNTEKALRATYTLTLPRSKGLI